MKKSNRTVTLAVLLAGVFATSAPAALALPPVGDDPIIICPRGYVLEDGVCVKVPPPPPPGNSPVVTLETPRQSTDRSAVRVAGRATDADQPATALTVRITVDGVLKRTVVANLPDPPVATQGFAATVPPPTLPGHGYNVVVSAPANAQNVCVTAVNVGGGSDRTVCKAIDSVLEFEANTISYDVAHAQITGVLPETLDRVTHTNNTNVQQSTSISGQKVVSNTHGWSATAGLKITVKGSVGIPLISKGEIAVEGSFSYTQNSSSTTTTTFAWQQPVLVPAHSKVVATIGVTKTTLVVPYALFGDYVYRSGARVAGSEAGTFSGVNGHDLEVRLDQFDLDGTPAANPVEQPAAQLLEAR